MTSCQLQVSIQVGHRDKQTSVGDLIALSKTLQVYVILIPGAHACISTL